MFASRSSRDLASQASASPPRSHRKGETPVKRENNSYGGTPARKGPRPSFINDTERVHRKKPSISFADLEYDDKFKTIAHRKQGKTITVLGQYVRLAPSPSLLLIFPSPFPLLQRANFRSVRPIVPLAMSKSDFISVSLLIRHSLSMTLRLAHSFNNSRSAFFHHSLFFLRPSPATVLLTSLVLLRMSQTATGREGG
jgi:hypothetical protein